MKNNRQVGLDGKIFVATCMRRGTFFVFILMLYGILTAAADILKLTGASGVAMGSFTTTLLIYDFIVSLTLVVVVFYAYFLECGANIPVLKEKPLVIFGFFRIGYYLLLSYYVCYHMLYCFVNRESVPITLGFFYALYLCLILLLILANCYIFNTITRNIIRRSYARSLRRLAIAGIIVQGLLPISYILVRVFMKNVGDEYFTHAVCDLIRLCVCPLLLISIWFLFLHAVEQVTDVYKEVDSALLNKCYQITYSTNVGGKAHSGSSATASATILPAPSETAGALSDGLSGSKKPKALKSGIDTAAAAVSAAVTGAAVKSAVESKKDKSDNAENTSEKPSEKPVDEQNNDAAAEKPAEENSVAEDSGVTDEMIADYAVEARKAVAKAAAEKAAKAQGAQNASAPVNNTPKKAKAAPNNTVPVQEFDPFPSSNHPRQTKTAQKAQPNAQQARPSQAKGGQRPQQNQQQRPNQQQGRPNNGQRPQQSQQRPNGAANGQRPQQRPNNGQRPQQNQQRPNQQNAQRGGNQQRGGHR